jgi:hypothetical protein
MLGWLGVAALPAVASLVHLALCIATCCHCTLHCIHACRVLCDGQPCLPVGTSDLPGTSTVKIFCPKCEDIYYPRIDYQVRAIFLSGCIS